MENLDAVIVGGGVAGAAMGVALGRFDVSAAVLEKRPRPGEINRGDALQVAAVAALDRIGALQPLVDAGAQRIDTVVFSHHKRGRLGSFSISSIIAPPHNYLLGLPHEKIETALIEESQRRGIPTRRGHALEDLRREGDGVVLSVRGPAGDYEIAARVVIGADGKFSTLRKHVTDEPETYWYEQECVVVEAECSGGAPLELRMHYHPDGLLVIAPLSPSVVRIYIITLRHDAARIFKLPAEQIGEAAVERDPSLQGYRFIKQGGHVFKMGLYHCGQYVSEGCALIGDAAHITSPAGGHGMNLAINDAEELADQVGPKLAAGGPVELADLKSYESQRRDANEKALRQAHDMFMRMTGPQLRYRLLRPLMFWALAHAPPIRNLAARSMLGVGASPGKVART